MHVCSSPGVASPVEFHNGLAAGWEDKYRKERFAARLELLARMLSNDEVCGKNWLDAGCGTGTLSRWLAARGARVHGLDAAPGMIEQAMRRLPKARLGSSLSYSVGNLEQLPFPDGCFSGVLASSVLEYVPAPRQCLQELARVLRPQGRLVLSVPNAGSGLRWALRGAFILSSLAGRPWPEWLKYSRHEFSRGTVLRLLEKTGFYPTAIQAFGVGIFPWLNPISFLSPLFMITAAKT